MNDIKNYIITFREAISQIVSGSSIKEIINKIYEYNNGTNEIFTHALDGMQTDYEYIKLYNTFNINPADAITHIYEINKEIGLKPNQEMMINL